MALKDRLDGMRRTRAAQRIITPLNSTVLPPHAQILGRPTTYLYGAGISPDLKEKFAEWRPYQEAAAIWMLDSPKRFPMACLPTGSGKTLAYIVAGILTASMTGGRVVVLTSTKGLQNQILKDFAGIGIRDIRGRQNYRCIALEEGGEHRGLVRGDGWTCDDGPCHHGRRCSLREGGCEYYDALRGAQESGLVVTNYAMWLVQSGMPPELRFDHNVAVLVLDEAHNAMGELCGHLETELTQEDMSWLTKNGSFSFPMDLPTESSMSGWVGTAQRVKSWLDAQEDRYSRAGTYEPRTGRRLRSLSRKFDRIARMQGEWVIQQQVPRQSRTSTYSIKFSPVWPAPHAESLLFRSIPKVVLSSATARWGTADLLGCPPSGVDLLELPSTFPPGRRPIYRLPAIQMNYRNEQDEVKVKWLISKMDLIIGPRVEVGLRGIIHTVSYRRRNYVQRLSRHAGLMISHDAQNARTVVEQFKSGCGPPILISPSISTGYDFPYDECRWQVILKIPMPDTRDEVTKRRCKENDEYGPMIAAQELMQMTGRGMRADDDWCETFILDDNIVWFVSKWRRLFTGWWLEAYQARETVPQRLKFF